MRSPVTRSAPLLPAGSPRIVGVVNITADSFSDGGRYLDPAAAVAHARRLRADGADVIELGPAASHPGSAPVSAAEERRRLAPVLAASQCRLVVMHAVQAAGAATNVVTTPAAVREGMYRFFVRGSGSSGRPSASPSWFRRRASPSCARSPAGTSPSPGRRRSPRRSSPPGRARTTSAPTMSQPPATRSPS